MKVFRKKLLIILVTCVAIMSLLNISLQFNRIIDCFPGMNISSLLVEELAETAEGGSEKSSESVSEPELLLTKELNTLHNLFFNHSVDVFFYAVNIPPQPHFDKITPPPKG